MNENLKGDKNHEYGVDWGLAHPMFLRMAENTNDIGLFRLDKDAIIRQAKIEISFITSFSRFPLTTALGLAQFSQFVFQMHFLTRWTSVMKTKRLTLILDMT